MTLPLHEKVVQLLVLRFVVEDSNRSRGHTEEFANVQCLVSVKSIRGNQDYRGTCSDAKKGVGERICVD